MTEALTLAEWQERRHELDRPEVLLTSVFRDAEERLTRDEVIERLREHELSFDDFRRAMFHDVWTSP